MIIVRLKQIAIQLHKKQKDIIKIIAFLADVKKAQAERANINRLPRYNFLDHQKASLLT